MKAEHMGSTPFVNMRTCVFAGGQTLLDKGGTVTITTKVIRETDRDRG